MPTTDDDTPPELRRIVVTPVGGGWRERALEAEEENRRLHEQLAAHDRTNDDLLKWARRKEARVAMLAARTRRLLRLAKLWRAPGRYPMPLYKKITVVIRYIVLGGHERGKGIGAAAQVARELKVSTSTVNRCLREAKSWRANRGVVLKMVEIYRRRYPGG